jgi:hypothetical protein
MRKRIPHLRILVVSEALVALFGLFAGISAQYADSPDPAAGGKPLWSIEPSDVGFKTNAKLALKMPEGRAVIKPFFLDPQRVAFAWFAPDQVPGRGPFRELPGRIHVSIHDVRTSREIGTHDWRSQSGRVDVAYTADGQWLTVSNGMLTLWSASFEKLSEMILDETAARYDEMNSPNARTCLVGTHDASGQHRYEMVDSHTFKVLDSWLGGTFAEYRHSDSYVAGSLNNVLSILQIGDTWKTLLLDPNIFDLSQPPLPPAVRRYIAPLGFATQDTLVIAPTPRRNQLAVISIAGQVLLSEKLNGNRDFQSVVSSGGGRFAILSRRERGSEALDMQLWADEFVHVYDVTRRAEICLITVKGDSPWPPFDAHWNSVAISSDGSFLAIASDYGLRVYALPGGDASGR